MLTIDMSTLTDGDHELYSIAYREEEVSELHYAGSDTITYRQKGFDDPNYPEIVSSATGFETYIDPSLRTWAQQNGAVLETIGDDGYYILLFATRDEMLKGMQALSQETDSKHFSKQLDEEYEKLSKQK